MLERLVARRPRHALQLSAARLGVRGLQVQVPPGSPLYGGENAELVELPLDAVIAPFVLDHGSWQSEELDFIAAHLPAGPSILIDVGANVGLVTRQLLHRLPTLVAAVCFEPHPGNFRFLTRNLAHLPRCHLVPAALGTHEQQMLFYEDKHNAGNYSLNRGAMDDAQYRTSMVDCFAATPERILSFVPEAQRALPIVWKSDTQGMDEPIMTALPLEFWNRVHGGVIEISRIDRPPFDHARFGSILTTYPIRRFGHEPERNVAVEEILAFATGGDDRRHQDLFFARS